MNARDPREDLNRAFPNKPMSENLIMRVQSLSNSITRPPSIFSPKRIAFATTAVGIAAIGVLLLAPQKASASFPEIMQTVDGAKTAHFTFLNAEGKQTRAMYYMDNMWRIEEGSQIVSIYVKGLEVRYARNQNVDYISKSNSPFSQKVTSFKISSLLGSHLGQTIAPPKQVSDKGRDATQYVVESGPERYDFYVDPTTELPYRCDLSYHGQDGWNHVSSIRMEFNTKLNPSLFQHTISRSIVNVDDAKPALLKKLAASRLAAVKTDQGECIIRDLQVNDAGDIFVLYTATGVPSNQVLSPLTVNDSQGNRYLNTDFMVQPINLTEGEALRAQWFTKASGDAGIAPDKITVSVYMNGNRVSDANQPTRWVATNRIPKDAKVVTQDMMDPVYEARPVSLYTVHHPKPTKERLPAYALLIGYPDITGTTFEMNKKLARARYWTSEQNWPKAEDLYRATIDAVKAIEDACGQQYAMGEFYDGLAKSLGKQGKTEEAQAAKAKADLWRSPSSPTAQPTVDTPKS